MIPGRIDGIIQGTLHVGRGGLQCGEEYVWLISKDAESVVFGMALMNLSLVQGDTHSPSSVAIDWPAVQLAQFRHDETYHREISRLTIHDRLKHMVLHFAKYAGRLLAAHDDQNFQQTTVDTFVIAVSCANILNLPVEKRLPSRELSPEGRDQFARELAITAGKMAAACEKMDHLEDFPFRQILVEETLGLLSVLTALFQSEGRDPVAEMHARLANIKEKSIFHGRE